MPVVSLIVKILVWVATKQLQHRECVTILYSHNTSWRQQQSSY